MGIPEENVFLIQIPKKELFAFLGNLMEMIIFHLSKIIFPSKCVNQRNI